MKSIEGLPPGQKEFQIFPRFGLPQYADRFPSEIDTISLSIGGDVEDFEIGQELNSLSRIDQTSNFHCVTTWSKLNLNWSGYLFSDFYTTFIQPKTSEETTHVVFKAQDGYKTSLPLSDLMEADVLLADTLDHSPLGIEHGAPIRIVAPGHYGYKNIKHIKRIEFYSEPIVLKRGMLGFMDHPRARVAYEERTVSGPAILFRYLYRFGIKGTIRDFEKAMAKYKLELEQSNTDIGIT